MKSNLLKLMAASLALLATAASAQVTGGGVTGGGVSGTTGVSGGLASDFASSQSPAGSNSKVGGLAASLERVFGKEDTADAECAKLGKCD
ncbi:hypothetical protein [Panacagrimonas sp.]|uniref:hypothetical protein n=1 Tax=Panacagrimonas sp. TaxID=2480088 RepID=UPI003B518AFF